MDTNLSYFLPSKSGDGLLSYILLNYLIDSQNELVEFCCKNTQIISVEANVLEFKENLVDFDPDNDFMRILKSNFIYDQKESQYWFMFDNMTSRVIERYIKNKPLIKTDLPVFVCSDEIGESNFYKNLDSIIKQVISLSVENKLKPFNYFKETLEPMLQIAIFQDFTSIDEAVDALNIFKILINYSKTISGHPNEYISNLVKKIYLEQNAHSILKTNVSF